MSRPDVLIEHWLPIEAIGAESKRERGASSALPPLYFLHVWWARRPLTASRAAILASVLPNWSDNWPKELISAFPKEETYLDWFQKFIGILGDPVAARKLIEYEKLSGKRSPGNKYGYPRAFTQQPSQDDIKKYSMLVSHHWGKKRLTFIDPFAGGGSIPFEALRFGFKTHANELNPVASVILMATLDFPAKYGISLIDDIKKWGNRWFELVNNELEEFFAEPKDKDPRSIFFWARSVSCPTTGKPVPLVTNWWINKSGSPIAVKPKFDNTMDEPAFDVLKDDEIDFDPNAGTVARGIGKSPWSGETISGDYIKSEAQAGRMQQILYCVETNTGKGKDYVPPEDFDIENFKVAENYLKQNLELLKAKNLIPTEIIPDISNYDRGHRLYGIQNWAGFFSARQLLVFSKYLNCLRKIENELESEMEEGRGRAIMTYLAFALDKSLAYNSIQSAWHSSRQVIASIFTKHNFSMTWSYVEFNASSGLLPWAINQIVDAYKGISNLSSPSQKTFLKTGLGNPVEDLKINQGSAANLSYLQNNSIDLITVDPPYYDNVQYAELSDFFYVWQKRSIGHLYPKFFNEELTNKDEEAVANPARFKTMGRKKAALAEQDYERKMTAAFREMNRVLVEDGILTVMFTHKKVEAWDTLASSLINAGFSIASSWPIHTESEHSLHQVKKNAAASTILLACRKRTEEYQEPIWWDDIQQKVRESARIKAEEFSEQGISGVDLYISTFGPTLKIISENWPVLTSEVDPKTGEPKPLRPEVALNLAREEVIRLRKEGLLLGRDVQFDSVTDWYLLAWDSFAAEQFPYDEARKLAIALGIEMDRILKTQKNIVVKKGIYVILQEPANRRKRGMVDDEVQIFEHLIDAVHTAMMIYEEDGPGTCDVFLMKTGLKRDSTFKACLQAMLNAIPRTKIKGKFARKEAEILENMRLAFFDDLEVPMEEEPEIEQAEQLKLDM